MIKIIKHGTKVFKAFCPVCGCEFEYEYEDLKKKDELVKFILCPDCGEVIYHEEYKEPGPVSPKTYKPWNPITEPYITWSNYDCEKCPNKPDYNGKPIIGDTPCTWCPKNQPYCIAGKDLKDIDRKELKND